MEQDEDLLLHDIKYMPVLLECIIILRTLPAARAWYYESLRSLILDPLLPDVLKGAPR
jgi:hypothetical protein